MSRHCKIYQLLRRDAAATCFVPDSQSTRYLSNVLRPQLFTTTTDNVYDSFDLCHHNRFRGRRGEPGLPFPRCQWKVRRDRSFRRDHHADAIGFDGGDELDVSHSEMVQQGWWRLYQKVPDLAIEANFAQSVTKMVSLLAGL